MRYARKLEDDYRKFAIGNESIEANGEEIRKLMVDREYNVLSIREQRKIIGLIKSSFLFKTAFRYLNNMLNINLIE
jgi:hypothetical protein